MWLRSVTALVALLQAGPAYTNSGLTSTSFSNELRSGFSRLFQNGVEQPVQLTPFVVQQRNPVADFRLENPLLQQRPVQFGPPEPTFQLSPPRPRFHPGFGKSRPNDVLVVVVKSNSNCTAPKNETTPADGDGGDDDDKGPNPDDDVEEVTIVAGGTEKDKEPSRCIWAILSCCAPANTPIRFTCFEVLGCSTAFWDTNPCVPAILNAALDQAQKFYGPMTNRTTATPPDATTETPAEPEAVDLKTGPPSAAQTAASTAQPSTSTAPPAA